MYRATYFFTFSSDQYKFLYPVFFLFQEKMSGLSTYYFTGIIALLVTLLLATRAYIRYVYSYWKRRNIPYLEPKFPFGNNDSIIPKGISIGIISKKFYKQFKEMKHDVGGKWDALISTQNIEFQGHFFFNLVRFILALSSSAGYPIFDIISLIFRDRGFRFLRRLTTFIVVFKIQP